MSFCFFFVFFLVVIHESCHMEEPEGQTCYKLAAAAIDAYESPFLTQGQGNKETLERLCGWKSERSSMCARMHAHMHACTQSLQHARRAHGRQWSVRITQMPCWQTTIHQWSWGIMDNNEHVYNQTIAGISGNWLSLQQTINATESAVKTQQPEHRSNKETHVSAGTKQSKIHPRRLTRRWISTINQSQGEDKRKKKAAA